MMRDPIQGLTLSGADGAPATVGRSWQVAFAVLTLALAWIVAWYWSTGTAMVGIWARSETFAHGFLVGPISLWLIWRARGDVAGLAPRPCWWIPVPIAAAGLGWLLGELGTVNAVSQFAFVALLVLAVPAVLGTQVARAFAFPLGFLFFAVPIGEFVMPQLMEWTAEFTVRALQITGIPVFREGQRFVIPTGTWSVVEACSGVRYLIASLVLGTLYAYLSYRSVGRRLAFVAFSIVVPVVANWVRAYMIVMLGHLSGNKIAVGVDHLIYGWIFFGVVIMLMFWVGAHWRDDDLALVSRARPVGASTGAAMPAEFLLVAAMTGVATMIWPLGYRAIERTEMASKPVLSELGVVGSWKPSADRLADWQPRFKDASAESHQTFRRGNAAVGMYVGYYRNQNSGRKLVSSDNTLVASNDVAWTRVASGVRTIGGDGKVVKAATGELKHSSGERLVAWYWYWIDGRLTASDTLAKAYTALSKLTGRGDDGAIIVVYAWKGRPEAAEEALDGFVRDMVPRLAAELGQVRDRR